MIKKIMIVIFTSLIFFSNILFAKEKNHFQLVEATIDSVHQSIKEGELTCEKLVNQYLSRIKKYNLALNRGAPINAIVSINPSVFENAHVLDQFYTKHQKLKGELHCIPVIVKDNIDTVHSPTTVGSLAMLGSQPIKDAFLVEKLKAAGAIILGKANMDEFASNMIGVSNRVGRTGNAYDPNQNVGGSSGGSAAAVSANFAMVGIGTDNSGSIRVPAAFNGIYGLRPTTGLISQTGIFPRGNLDATAGPMARNIKDLAKVLSVIAKKDPVDEKTKNVPRESSYEQLLDENYLNNKRIGVIYSVAGHLIFDQKNKEAQRIFQRVFDQLKKQGALVFRIELPEFDVKRKYNTSGEIEDVNAYLSSFPSTRKNFEDICLSNRTNLFGNKKKCLKRIKATKKKPSKQYRKTLEMFKKNRKYVEGIIKTHRLDALLTPLSSNGAATYDLLTLNTWRFAVAPNAGLPAITFIGGYTSDVNPMPVGMQFIGKSYDEKGLINMVYAFEVHSKRRVVPNLGDPVDANQMSLSIPEYNNLLTTLGYATYRQFLQHNTYDQLTPNKFNKILKEVLK